MQVIIAEARQVSWLKANRCNRTLSDGSSAAGLDSHWKSPGGSDIHSIDDSEWFDIAPSLTCEFRTAMPVSARRTAPLALPRKDAGGRALGVVFARYHRWGMDLAG